LEKEEEEYIDQLSACITMLPQIKNPDLPVSTSFFTSLFLQANLSIVQKRKFLEEEEENNNNNNIPQKKAKILKEDDNKPKQRKEKRSIYHYLSGDVKKKWSILGRVINMTEERRLQWAKVWCNRTHTTCPLIRPEDEFDSDDFEMCEQLIQDQIILEAQANLEKVKSKKLTSTLSTLILPEEDIEIVEDNTEMNADAILDEALADLSE
jgi:hypothetical protein